MTIAEGVLSDGARRLREAGYTVLRGALSPDETQVMRALSDSMSATAAAILAETLRTGRRIADHARDARELIVVPEAANPAQVCRYEYMIGATPEFRRFVERVIRPLVERAAGEAMVPFKDKTNEKAAGGGAFGTHQDFAAYRFFPPRNHVTAVVSVHPATRENGCVQFATNYRDVCETQADGVAARAGRDCLFESYKDGMRNGDVVDQVVTRLQWEAVELAPQDIVLFDSYVPHYSEKNASSAPRRAMFLTFNRAAEGDFYETYYADKRRHYHDPKFHVSTPTLRDM